MVSPVSALSAFLPPFLPFFTNAKVGRERNGGERDFKKEKRRGKLFSRSGGGGMAEGGGEAEIQRIALWRLGGRENGGLPTRPRATEVVGPFCFPAVFLCLKNAWWNVVEGGGEAETGCFLFLPLSSFFTATTAENDRLQSSRPTLSLLRPGRGLTQYTLQYTDDGGNESDHGRGGREKTEKKRN